ncbi:MAG: bifunctional demethylmenaquinone methyltransferase/2-methoxy-6-polyprenyl-1,4-benzoquinol methylase UbiE [Bacteroidales bacterium]|nr:bifunctional demethylmenaquinone methyltransferase/2-methoxy-6-polyprenyl-1,4-benzoquinol methylase UbiE [Bacteroidales bacterium]
MEQLNKNKANISVMFNDIAPKYDFLNHFLSLGIDKIWRRKVIKTLSKSKYDKILDVATGTGDLALDLLKLKPKKIIGIDIAEKMVEIGNRKIEKKNLTEFIELKTGDSLEILYNDSTFDAATCSFGVRNFEDLKKGLSEMHRVLKFGGKIAILEFSNPKNKLVSFVYRFYFNKILPLIGRLFSKNTFAYKYLPQSVAVFPSRDEFIKILDEVGFKNTFYKNLTYGIACIYIGVK